MIKHVVLWNFKGAETVEEKKQQFTAIKTAVQEQVGLVDGLESMDVSLNLVPAKTSRDLILEARFSNLDSLRAYHQHEAHDKVRAIVDPLVCDTAEIDIEIG